MLSECSKNFSPQIFSGWSKARHNTTKHFFFFFFVCHMFFQIPWCHWCSRFAHLLSVQCILSGWISDGKIMMRRWENEAHARAWRYATSLHLHAWNTPVLTWDECALNRPCCCCCCWCRCEVPWCCGWWLLRDEGLCCRCGGGTGGGGILLCTPCGKWYGWNWLCARIPLAVTAVLASPLSLFESRA